MIVTMMLPSSMPTLGMFRQVNRANAGGGGATAAFLAGFAATWTLFGVIAFTGDILVHQLIHHWSWLAWHPWTIAGITLLTAGAFQFSSSKERCLAECRTPSALFACHYRRGYAGAWRLGLKHGKHCLGSCWGLMLVMFGLGMGNVVWMAGLTDVMLLERVWWSGRNRVRLLGSSMVVWGALVLAHPMWLPAILT
jgi:predicted metal-binding membrane protein